MDFEVAILRFIFILDTILVLILPWLKLLTVMGLLFGVYLLHKWQINR